MIFRLATFVSAVAFVAGQNLPSDANDARSMPASAALMRASGVDVGNSNMAGVVTLVGRENPVTNWDIRWDIDVGVSMDNDITAVNLHCPISSDTETAPMVNSFFGNFPSGVESADEMTISNGASIVRAPPLQVQYLTTGDMCYLNFTTNDYPGGELRANIRCNQILVDFTGELETCPSSASTLATSSALVLSMMAAAFALF